MNESARQTQGPAPARPAARGRGLPLLEKLVLRQLAVIWFERVWRTVIALAALAGLFLAVSWAGLWQETGRAERVLGLFAFGAAGLIALTRGLLLAAPSRASALVRLDRSAEAQHRLASSFDDTLAGNDHDPATIALWASHRRRLDALLRSVDVALPSPRLVDHDPFALRALALVAAIGAAFAAGPERQARLLAAFDWRPPSAAGTHQRLDAWLDPPAYTGRPPIVLPLSDAVSDAPAEVAAPVNSTLTVRMPDDGGIVIETSGALAAIEPAPGPPDRAASSGQEKKFKLTGNADLALRASGRSAALFALTVIPDRPPSIDMTEAPRNNARGSLTLHYRIDDDYGVIGAEAVFSRPVIGGQAVAGRTLVPPPRADLRLPASPRGLGEARSTSDLADHPWAGAQATMTLTARDDGGAEGVSAPVETTLPQRRFAKPLARALAEQRRNLVLDPERQRAKVGAALAALTLGAELFDVPAAVHLGVTVAKTRLESARSDADLLDVADLLWAMVLRIEDGDRSLAEHDLRAAEKTLREALARGADDQEISRLTEELRTALHTFLQGLSEQGARQGEPRPQQEEGSRRSVTEQDIQSMLERMEKAGKSGDLAEAQRLLDDLQDVLENLQPSQGADSARRREMARALDELDRLSREQRQLRDDTHRAPKFGGEARRQQSLRAKLEQQQKRMAEMGEGGQDLDVADEAMKEAEQALAPDGEGKGKAVGAQGRALQALRRGADQLAARLQGEGQEGAEGADGSSGGRPRAGPGDDDPLGRAGGRRRGYDSRARYDPLGLPPALRARRVQEELRRRLGEPERPADELDYLQRLLRR
ncbi:MAG: TIGR02302 family protein [Methylocystis sp.]|nr:TIGR02302 family protein [Methylocystis sp.]